ncbi:MAG: antitoxin Xre-like helix-turn-helix domain-containing protein [Burkholderiales bacterium]
MTTATSFPKAAALRAAKAALVARPQKSTSIWARLTKDSHTGYAALYVMPPIDRAVLVKKGAPSNMVGVISKEMDMSKDRFVRIMGLSRATVTRKMANKADLSVDESERLVGLAKLIGQVETIVKQSGNPVGFKPAKWFSEWIEQPAAALGGRMPEELLDTSDGREAVAKLLAQMQSGAYA